MQYEWPWIPDGEPLELRGQVGGVRADLVKGEMVISLKLPVTPYTLSLRERLRVMVDMPLNVAVEIQALRMTMEKLADLRSAPAEPGREHQPTLGDFVAELGERMQEELGDGATVTVSRGGLPPLPTLLEAQVAEAEAIAKEQGGATIALLQRKMRIGYHRAAELLEKLRKREQPAAPETESESDGETAA